MMSVRQKNTARSRLGGSILLAALLLVNACTSLKNTLTQGADYASAINAQRSAPATTEQRSSLLIQSGLEYLRAHDLHRASTTFNAAIKTDPENAVLHFLNGLTYQLRLEEGDKDSYSLAETGYRVAAALDPSMSSTQLQLGHLYLRGKSYPAAQQAFAQALESGRVDLFEAAYGLAVASFYAADPMTARYAIARLDALNPTNPQVLRAKSYFAALAGNRQGLEQSLAAYRQLETDRRQIAYVSSRTQEILAQSVAQPTQTGATERPAVQGASAAGADALRSDTPGSSAESAGRKNWFRCDPRPAPVAEKEITALLTPERLAVNEANAPAATLPHPCPGEQPAMALIEVTMIRTEESLTRTLGINLLDSLKLGAFASYSGGGVFSGGTRTASRSLYNTLGDSLTLTPVGVLPATAGYLQYSLNIANSLLLKNEVIARPTLTAVDRLPSVFFSGGTLSIKVPASAGGVSSIVDKSVGTVLSITPTFMDDGERVLLNIRAGRAFREDSPDTLNIALNITRNSLNATALVRFGETFVLNGLVERETDRSSSGTPGLQDIPVLQYLFKNALQTDFNRQILTLVTVRRLIDSQDAAQKAQDSGASVATHKLAAKVKDYLSLQANKPVLDELFTVLRQDNSLFSRLSQRDLIQDLQGSKPRIDRILTDLKEMAYF